jgi:hypothetical protein
MHRPLGKFRHPFESHALVHHRVFKADDTYHLINPKDAQTIVARTGACIFKRAGSVKVLSWGRGFR